MISEITLDDRTDFDPVFTKDSCQVVMRRGAYRLAIKGSPSDLEALAAAANAAAAGIRAQQVLAAEKHMWA